MTPALPPNERCARCGGPFRCGVNDDTPCACTTVTLSPELLARLRLQFTGCLCVPCLRVLAAGAEAAG
jgi:Cysteine-rich CWC